jgi:beta-1,4-mannosyl-glycoprotein beta-1,4-N-acetylglucosaminyltransferase
LLSDLDEIPNPVTVIEVRKKMLTESIVYFRHHEFCHYLNYYHNSDWIGTCCFLFSEFGVPSLNAIRAIAKSSCVNSLKIVDNGGWHFTSIGSVEAIKKKIQSWGHKEFNTSATLNSVEYNVRHGYDIFRRHGFGKLVCLPIERSMFPAYLVENVGKFENLIGPEIVQESLFKRLFFTFYFKIQSKFNSVLSRVSFH